MAKKSKKKAATNKAKVPKVKRAKGLIRAGSDRAKIVAMADGTKTLAQIAARIDKDAKYVTTALYCLKRDCGLDYEANEGKPKIKPPKGKSLSDLVG